MCLLQTHTTTTHTHPPPPPHFLWERVFKRYKYLGRGQCCVVKGHYVYGGQLPSLHNIFTTDASCSSSELSTVHRDVFAFPLGKWEPSVSRGLWLRLLPSSKQTAIFSFPCPIYSLSSTSPFSWSLTASFFAFTSVAKLVGSRFLIPRVLPEILQLIGCNCEVIVSQTWECCQAYQFCRVLKNWDCSFSLIHEIFRYAVHHISADLSANTSFQIQDGFL